MTEPLLYENGLFHLRYLLPDEKQDIRRIILLLHGWTGDENTMWIFFRQPPSDALLMAPRGLVNADPTGYGWFRSAQKLDTPVEAYLPSVLKLLQLIDDWMSKNKIPGMPIDVVGFSQGAAVAGVLGTLFPERVRKTAILAGFLPPDITDQLDKTSLLGKQFYLAHGTRDEVVPIELSETTAAALSSAGARVTYCSSDAAHKLSVDCAKGLQEFLYS